MNTIQFAIAGFGHAGKKHATAIKNNPFAELAAIIEVDNTKRIEATNQFNVPVYQSLKELKENAKEIRIISICTPNHLHAPIAIQALNEGYHVIIEKPMALTTAECEQIIFTSLNVSRNIFVVKQNRYSPPSKWLKSIVEKGILGKIFLIQINCYWNRDEKYYVKGSWRGDLNKDGGTLFTQFSHFIDILYWIFGDIRNIQSRFANFNHKINTQFEDSGIISFELINGGMGCINFSTTCWDKNMESSLTIIAANGSVKIGGQYMNEVEYCHIKDYQMPVLEPTSPPNDYGPYKGSAANHHLVIQNVIDNLEGKSSIDTNAFEGLKVIDIIERIYEQRNLKETLSK